MKKLITLFTALLMTTTIMAKGLHLKTFNPGKEAIFQVTSTIVYGEKEAYLIDAQFQKRYAEELVKEIKAMGRTLKLVYVSYVDPDFYFGLDVIHKAFPEARIVSTAQTAWLISATKDAKLKVWGDKLGADAPSELIVPQAVASLPELEGNKIEIRQRKEDPAHSYLWIPSLKAIVGGISNVYGQHVWMADTQDEKALDNWITIVEDMKCLHPETVVPSHYAVKEYNAVKVLGFMSNYLAAYKKYLASEPTGEAVAEKMRAQFPSLPGYDEVVLGAKVFKGEAQWESASPYPAVGRSIVVDFGDFAFRNTYPNNTSIHFLGISGSYKDVTDDVKFTAKEVAKNVFMVYWHEPKSGANVVHVQNYNTGTVWTNIANPDGSFYNMQGKLTLE